MLRSRDVGARFPRSHSWWRPCGHSEGAIGATPRVWSSFSGAVGSGADRRLSASAVRWVADA